MENTFDFFKEFEQKIEETGVTNVVVLGHMNPDGDSVGSVFGLSHYLRTAYPELDIYPYMPTVSEKGTLLILEEEAVFDRMSLPEEPYIVICCDTATKERVITGDVFDKALGSIGIDHHRSNEKYCDVNYVEFAESCAELIFWLLAERGGTPFTAGREGEAFEGPVSADYIYMGILHDTAVFTRANVSTLRAAANLLELGVSHRSIMRTWETQTLDELRKQNHLIGTAKTIADGKVAYLVKNNQEAIEEGISYDDIHHISNYLRNCSDVVAAFTMYEQEPGHWRCSLRSDGVLVDANEVFGRFGGGGHKGAAGLRIRIGDAMEIKKQLLTILEELVMK